MKLLHQLLSFVLISCMLLVTMIALSQSQWLAALQLLDPELTSEEATTVTTQYITTEPAKADSRNHVTDNYRPELVSRNSTVSTQKPAAVKQPLKKTEKLHLQYLKSDKVKLKIYQGNISDGLPPLQNSFSSKELVVYTSHLFRKPNGSSYIIILIGAGPSVYKLKSVIGCGVNNRYGKNFKVRYAYEDIRQQRWQKFKKRDIHRYQQIVVECYGVSVNEGDKAFLVYHNTSSNKTTRIYSDDPVVIPAPRKPPKAKEGKVSSVVCTKVLSRGVSWLPEFLRYQKTLGVDHVHIAVLDTFIKDGGFHDILANDTFFMDAIKKKYITVQIWKEWYGSDKWQWFYYGNLLMYLDCIYRYRGTYDFVSLFDTDDFFTIRVPGMSYKDFLVKYCLRKGIGSCSFRWLFYYPGVCGLKKKVGEDGNVTSSLIPHSPINEQSLHFKSTHFSSAVIDTSFHDASCNQCLVEGYRAILIPSNIAYVAHNRLNKERSAKSVCH